MKKPAIQLLEHFGQAKTSTVGSQQAIREYGQYISTNMTHIQTDIKREIGGGHTRMRLALASKETSESDGS
jgi:hypothetical protein